jgi:hypothetical protein
MTSTLAQSLLRDVPPPTPLPDPPWLESVLFESPWLTIGVLLLVGGAVFAALRAAPSPNAQRTGRWLAGLAALGALGLGLSAALVQTPREALIEQTRTLIQAIARADAPAADAAFAPGISLSLLGQPTRMPRAEMIDRVRTDMGGRYALRDRAANISALRAIVDGPGVARVQCRVQAVHDATGFPASTWWLVHFRQAEPGRPWLVHALELQQFDGLPAGTRISP